MKQLTKKFSAVLAAFLFVAVALVTPVTTVSAADCDPSKGATTGIECAKGEGVPGSLFSGNDAIFTTVVNILLFIIGAVSVIMLIWGGIRYTTSAGNSSSITAAKNTIMYAIIGLIIAFLAYAIVNWLVASLNPGA